MLSLAPGHVLTDEHGNAMSVVNHLGRGGQGDTYVVASARSGVRRVVKLFFNDGPVTRKRIEWLVSACLPRHCPALVGPLARLGSQHGLGVVLPLAPGVSLEALFQAAPLTLADALAIAAALCRAVDALEQLGAGHGDLSAMNVFVERAPGGVIRVYLIDMDNVAVAKLPRSPMLGSPLYVAPEVGDGSERPSIVGDRWSLGVLLYELLTGMHPFTALGSRVANTAAYIAELKNAGWIDDPLHGGSGNAAVLALGSPEIHAQFRKTFQPNQWTRPSALSWTRVLESAIGDLQVCPNCGTECVNHAGRGSCPGCNEPANALALAIGGCRISLRAAVTTIGRDDVGGEPSVSHRHVVIRRFGLGAKLRDVSTNGTAVFTRGRWAMVPRGEEVGVMIGDRVMFARGVEGGFEEA